MRAVWACLALLLAAGCISLVETFPLTERPRHDQVLVYDEPFDFTYLRTLEALNTFPNWVLEETDKEKGLIVLRSVQYGHLFDVDKEAARFRVKRIDRGHTSVALAPDSQQVRQGLEFLKRIDSMMPVQVLKE